MPVQGWRACYGTGTTNRECPMKALAISMVAGAALCSLISAPAFAMPMSNLAAAASDLALGQSVRYVHHHYRYRLGRSSYYAHGAVSPPGAGHSGVTATKSFARPRRPSNCTALRMMSRFPSDPRIEMQVGLTAIGSKCAAHLQPAVRRLCHHGCGLEVSSTPLPVASKHVPTLARSKRQ